MHAPSCSGMEREWLIGQQLDKLAQKGEEEVPGELLVGDLCFLTLRIAILQYSLTLPYHLPL